MPRAASRAIRSRRSQGKSVGLWSILYKLPLGIYSIRIHMSGGIKQAPTKSFFLKKRELVSLIVFFCGGLKRKSKKKKKKKREREKAKKKIRREKIAKKMREKGGKSKQNKR